MQVEIEKLVAGGDGLARKDGRVIFVPYSVPGDVLEIEIIEEKKNFARGKIRSIVSPGPHRTEPRCSHFGSCGGCSLQHIEYSAQKNYKAQAALEGYQKLGELSLDQVEVESEGDGYNYRNRIQLQQDEQGHIGFMKGASNQVFQIQQCPVLLKELETKIVSLSSQKVWKGRNFFDSGQKLFYPGQDCWVSLLGKNIQFSTDGFFQSNLAVFNKALKDCANYLKGKSIFDLYGGVGTFGAVFGKFFKSIHVVEMNRQTQVYAKKNLEGFSNRIYSGTLEKWIAKNRTLAFDAQDWVVVDPPRTGLSTKVREFLLEKGPANILYLSCNPSTQARDLKDLTKDAYSLDFLKLYDFYPQTPHLEALAVLKKK